MKKIMILVLMVFSFMITNISVKAASCEYNSEGYCVIYSDEVIPPSLGEDDSSIEYKEEEELIIPEELEDMDYTNSLADQFEEISTQYNYYLEYESILASSPYLEGDLTCYLDYRNDGYTKIEAKSDCFTINFSTLLQSEELKSEYSQFLSKFRSYIDNINVEDVIDFFSELFVVIRIV